MAKKTAPKKDSIEEIEQPVKNSDSFLPADYRNQLIAQLAEFGYKDGETLNDSELLEKLQSFASAASKQFNESIATEEQRIEAYFHGMHLTNMDFKIQLYEAGIPRAYLHLFRDTHAPLVSPIYDDKKEFKKWNMKEIWKIVRESGINPLTTEEVFKSRHVEPLFKNKDMSRSIY